MHKGPNAALHLAKSLKLKLTDIRKTEMAVCPPSISIAAVRDVLKDTKIKVGAQNMYLHKYGAYTGEISAEMIKESGCEYVIIGHSERRQHFFETDTTVNHKIEFALQELLTPIVCVGETLEQRQEGHTESVIRQQYLGAMKNLDSDKAAKIIIAYEPIWAIGTGKNATVAEAEAVHKFIRDLARESFGKTISDKMIIQYGGSVKPDNAAALLGCVDIDGALVGGASLEAESFAAIIHAAEKI